MRLDVFVESYHSNPTSTSFPTSGNNQNKINPLPFTQCFMQLKVEWLASMLQAEYNGRI